MRAHAKCNAPPKLANVKFNYGLGWERAVRATDYKLVWERASSGVKSSFMDQIAYVRKIEYFGGGDGGVCSGRVTLVTVDSSTIESTVECSNSGRNIVSYSDIENYLNPWEPTFNMLKKKNIMEVYTYPVMF